MLANYYITRCYRGSENDNIKTLYAKLLALEILEFLTANYHSKVLSKRLNIDKLMDKIKKQTLKKRQKMYNEWIGKKGYKYDAYYKQIKKKEFGL